MFYCIQNLGVGRRLRRDGQGMVGGKRSKHGDPISITNFRQAQTVKKEGLHSVADTRRLYLEVSYKQRGTERSPAHGVTRSWIYRYTSPVVLDPKTGKGKKRSMGLGSVEDIGFLQAKTKARQAAGRWRRPYHRTRCREGSQAAGTPT
jgi:Arm domain-containing DNA-binding protein